MERRIELRQFASVFAMFLIVQFGGLLLAIVLFPPSQLPPINQSSVNVGTTTSGIPFFVIFLLELIVVTVVLILVFKYVKISLIFAAFGALVVALPLFIFFSSILSIPFPQPNPQLYGGVILTVLFIILMYKKPQSKNIIVMLSILGLGLIGVFFSWFFAYLLFAVLAIYDYIAVFITKHMLTLANVAMRYNMPFLVDSSSVVVIPQKSASQKDIEEIKKQIKASNTKDRVINEVLASGNVPIVSRIGLGNGDMGIPLLLIVSSYISFMNYFIPLMIALGSTVGLLLTFYILNKYKVALPALPPIFGPINLFMGLAVLILYFNLQLALLFLIVGAVSSFVVYSKARSLYAAAHPRSQN